MQESGKPVTDLPRSEEIANTVVNAKTAAVPDQKGELTSATGGADQKSGELAKAVPGIDTTTWVVFLSCLVGGLGMVGWVIFRALTPKPKSKPKSFGRKESPVSFAGINAGPIGSATFVPPAAPAKTRPRSASGSTVAGASPAEGRPASRSAPQPETETPPPPRPKPRPRPPSSTIE